MYLLNLVMKKLEQLLEEMPGTKGLYIGLNETDELDEGLEPKGSPSEGARFILGEVRGEKPLIVVGVNPSTANVRYTDPTLRAVKAIAESRETGNGDDGWIVLNLYPQRTPRPQELHCKRCVSDDYIDANIAVITAVLKRFPDAPLLAAWGDAVGERAYLAQCRDAILKVAGPRQWLCLNKPTRKGNPRHPLYTKVEKIKPLAFDEKGHAHSA